MTETATFPFDTDRSTDDELLAAPNRRKLFLLIALGVVLVTVVGYFVAAAVLAGPDVTSTLPGTQGNAPAAGVTASPAPAGKPTPQAAPAGTNRNPFVPLVVVAASKAAPAAPAASPVATTPATTPGQTTFKLVSVSGSQAVASIDGVSYPVTVGQVFAVTYRLTATSGGACADFTNNGKKMSLCEGQILLT